MTNERLVFLILLCLIGGLLHIIAYWRRKTGEAAFTAARIADKGEERDRRKDKTGTRIFT